MKHTLCVVAACILLAGVGSAAERLAIGGHVEARTPEVLANDCMNGEADPVGRPAILAWRIATGSFDGVSLEGLTVVVAEAGERNAGTRETDGDSPVGVKAIISVDPRATIAQRNALVAFVRERAGGLIAEVVRVEIASMRFATSPKYVEVIASEGTFAF